MTVKTIAKILWSPVRRVDELLRVDSDVAELEAFHPTGEEAARQGAVISGFYMNSGH